MAHKLVATSKANNTDGSLNVEDSMMKYYLANCGDYSRYNGDLNSFHGIIGNAMRPYASRATESDEWVPPDPTLDPVTNEPLNVAAGISSANLNLSQTDIEADLTSILRRFEGAAMSNQPTTAGTVPQVVDTNIGVENIAAEQQQPTGEIPVPVLVEPVLQVDTTNEGVVTGTTDEQPIREIPVEITVTTESDTIAAAGSASSTVAALTTADVQMRTPSHETSRQPTSGPSGDGLTGSASEGTSAARTTRSSKPSRQFGSTVRGTERPPLAVGKRPSRFEEEFTETTEAATPQAKKRGRPGSSQPSTTSAGRKQNPKRKKPADPDKEKYLTR
jgi:hypothetical protein